MNIPRPGFLSRLKSAMCPSLRPAQTTAYISSPVSKIALTIGSFLLTVPALLVAEPDCEPFLKQISVDGGITWFDADTPADAPNQGQGGDALFRFVLTNCDAEICTNTRISDKPLNLADQLVGDGVINPGETIIVDQNTPGFSSLYVPGLCHKVGTAHNTATETTFLGNAQKPEVYTAEAYLNCIDMPPTASLGDRVWEDINLNGIQDCTDSNMNGILGDLGDMGSECGAGIPDVPVELFSGDCSVSTGMMTTTDANGFYLFENLDPNDYCVKFTKPGTEFCETDGYDLGTPLFTEQNVGADDEVDSDADVVSGLSSSVTLNEGDVNRSVDAGIYCPAKIGDFVWLDDGDGIQEQNESGVEGVTVELFECGMDGIAGTDDDIVTGEVRVTDANGLYMFGAENGFDLAPGSYYTMFSKPTGYDFTVPKQGGDDTVDSDCLEPDGISSCVVGLGSRGINLNRDCGLVPPPPPTCNLVVDKTCAIVPPPPPPPSGGKCDGKLQQFSVIWTGDTTTVGGVSNDAPGGVVNNGDRVTFFGQFSDNDVIVDVGSGQSTFHVSCSDDDFNTPDDCGKVAGDGKKNDGGNITDWLVDGWIDDSNDVLECSTNGGSTEPEFPIGNSCEASLSAADCSLGKPTSLTLKYTGSDCTGTATQGGKGKCSDHTALSDTVQLVATGKDADKFIFSPDNIVTRDSSDDSVTITMSDGKKLKSSVKIDILDLAGTTVQQDIELHASCSQPLAVNDKFGGLTVSHFNGEDGAVEVLYGYTVQNLGDLITGITVTDDLLGDVGGPVDLANGEIAWFTATGNITETTTNVATATGFLTSGGECVAADELTVAIVEPPVPPASCDDGKPKTLVFEYTGQDCSASSNDQGSKAICTGSLNGEEPVFMEYVGKDPNKIDMSPATETISVGDMVTLNAFDKSRLHSASKIEISQGGQVIQEIELHTSCSQTLNIGDQFGSLLLKEFIPE